jgi:chaperone required for assembly of F1-ATPase
MFVAQSEAALAALALATRSRVGEGPAAAFRLAALYELTTLTGSLALALAVASGEMTVDAAWAAAHVDEDFQMRTWGADAEALARRERRFTDMRAAAFLAQTTALRP